MKTKNPDHPAAATKNGGIAKPAACLVSGTRSAQFFNLKYINMHLKRNMMYLKDPQSKRLYALALIMLSTLFNQWVRAQNADGNAGISQANTMIRGYYEGAIQLMYGIGALLAIIGAVRVYYLWGGHNNEAQKAAAGWFGACVFLVIVTTVIKAFFGL
jgi:hypothetical protein